MGETAILMAAGMGTRMRPLTRTTPKPLIPVHGTPMIETVIQGLLTRPVEKVYVVTGYLREQFSYLEEKYPQLELVFNEEYETKNNISSIYAAGERLGGADCFICEADLLIRDRAIFQKDMKRSCYFGREFTGYCDDWIFELQNDRITRIRKGGKDTFQMVGISYFRREDAAIIRNAVCEAYRHPGHEALFWDEIVDRSLDKLNLGITPVYEGQILELDTVEELSAADESYRQEFWQINFLQKENGQWTS